MSVYVLMHTIAVSSALFLATFRSQIHTRKMLYKIYNEKRENQTGRAKMDHMYIVYVHI